MTFKANVCYLNFVFNVNTLISLAFYIITFAFKNLCLFHNKKSLFCISLKGRQAVESQIKGSETTSEKRSLEIAAPKTVKYKTG